MVDQLSSGGLLRQARREAGLTQMALAARAGVNQSVISAYESGRRQPSLPQLVHLIAATGHALHASLSPLDDSEEQPALRPSAKLAMSGPLGRRVGRHAEAIKRIAAAYGAGRVRVFGSVARGEDHAESDVDLLLDLPPSMGLFALGRLRRDLEDLLDVEVDLIPSDGLKPEVRDGVEADVIDL